MDVIEALAARSRMFGPRAAASKLRLLARIARQPRAAAHRLRWLRDTLDFMRAYPDDARVRAAVERALASLPLVAAQTHAYSYGVARRLVERDPHELEIDWDAGTDEAALGELLAVLVTPGETQGVEDISIPYRAWFALARTNAHDSLALARTNAHDSLALARTKSTQDSLALARTKSHDSLAGPALAPSDLAFLLALLAGSGLSQPWQAHVYDRLSLPLRYLGPARTQLSLAVDRVHYQRSDIDRGRSPIEPAIRSPLPRPKRGARAIMDLALQALCARKLEIYPLIHGNADDIHVVACDRGITIVLVGVLPEFRSPLETLCFFLVLKNGVPIAYGPAGVFLGCCEMGINLFPEFRGGEIRFIYAQFMRALHQVLGVQYFFLTRYGMGEGNDEAIESGAFWFYRKLGFRPTSAEVEALALDEERKIAAHPGYRSDRRMLRRLSHTEAFLDLSGGHCQPFDFGGLGIAQSRFLAREFGLDRARAEAECTQRSQRLLRVRTETLALAAMAPILAMIPDLARWSSSERHALAAIVAAKGARSEFPAAPLFARHERLARALRAMARGARDHVHE